MAGYYDPTYGPVGFQPEPAGTSPALRRLVDAVFAPGDPRAEEAAVQGQDPRFRFDDSAPTPPMPAGQQAFAPAQTPPARVAPVAAPSDVIHEAAYNPGSFLTGDVRSGFSEDRSRGERGTEWARDITRRHGDSEVVRAPSEGPHTQGELEGLANARRMMDAAYGPTHAPFDPDAARLDALDEQAKLKLAEARAQDPVAFARMQAQIPAEAQTGARIASGERLAGLFGKFDEQLQGIDQRRFDMRQSKAYEIADEKHKKEAEARLDNEAAHVHSNLRAIQQAMGFATGQTPSTLYSETLGQ